MLEARPFLCAVLRRVIRRYLHQPSVYNTTLHTEITDFDLVFVEFSMKSISLPFLCDHLDNLFSNSFVRRKLNGVFSLNV